MIIQLHVLLAGIDGFIEEAGRLKARSESAESCESLLAGVVDFEARIEPFLSSLPEDIGPSNIGRHLHFTKHFLGKGRKENCDFAEILEFDLPGIRQSIIQYFAANKHFDPALFDGVNRLMQVKEYSSAVQKAFVILSERIRTAFEIEERIDGKQLVIRAFKEKVELTTLNGEESEAIRNLLLGLYSYFRNKYSHASIRDNLAEASVVLDMINYMLFEIGRIMKARQ